ncbi:hypothetical protein LEAN103870_15515 [Legionella anisa]|uniref:Uncharacterized protein n=1 Tax=Legionella anisa TaxID=28082 RepID=A0AAX0WSL7_9GAMM|nr:hypothetical protein [Legionella anisa]AWN74792.1 hypothetical protein DLD14_13620 [Legionella anisa]KTC77595.1 hypothetical protein Lani_0153 [Legionella anisa]MBN5936401.1 hypothetical protein [Legionella anisa]MCW8425079.1 hypothetical protein [Legionella anisa]MCW8445805.1 hypothetical protein [Legionella anisa]
MIIRVFINLEKGEIGLRANKSNQSSDEIKELIDFLNDHPEITTIHFSHSFITQELAEKLAAIQTVKKINLFNHSHVTFDFYKNSNSSVVADFQQKYVQESDLLQSGFFASKEPANPNSNQLPENGRSLVACCRLGLGPTFL